MLRTIFSFIKSFKARQTAKKHRRAIEYMSSIAVRKYKVALIDAFERGGPHTKQLIILRIKAGNIWSQRQFNKILTKIFAKNSELSSEACLPYVDYSAAKAEFATWSKKFFLPVLGS
jgi:hypothetical protein